MLYSGHTVMMSTLGTMAWAEQCRGTIASGERFRMVLQGAKSVLLSKLPAKVFAGAINAERPTTAFAKHAEIVLAQTSPPWLVNHGIRTYAWACAFAERDGLAPDRELLYCASLLHDLGIAEAHLPPMGECFAHAGALQARDTLRAQGMPEARAQIVAEAICLHLNLVVDVLQHGPEANLLRAATACDVVGQDYESMSEAFRTKTLEEIPRLDFKREVAAAMERQVTRSPKTRIGFLCNHLGLIARVHKAPFRS
jgi:HD superfamily phosphodiesterase